MEAPNNNINITNEFNEAIKSHQLRFAKVGCVLALVLVPAGVTLDYFVYPEYLETFLILRILCDVVIAGIFSLYFTSFGKSHVKIITFSWITVVQITLSTMIYMTEGSTSSYYAGLNLAILGAGIILPLSFVDALTFSFITVGIYLTACLAHTATPFDISALYNNTYFIILTGIISTAAAFFNNRLRLSEFRLNHELNIRNKELTRLDQMKSDFFANISHELRTPLTLILAPVEDLLKNNTQYPAETNNIFHTVKKNANRLLVLVNDILEIVRLEEGKTKLDNKPIDVNIVLNGIIDSVSHHAKNQGLTINKTLSGTPLVINGDQYALEKIFINLLGNAIKFTDHGGFINVSSRLEENEVKINIDDSGIGINEEELPYIFNRFHQVDGSSTRKHTGTGLGLTLVKELTEQQHGKVAISSQPNVGTNISIAFPYSKETPVIIDNPVINTDVFIDNDHCSDAETVKDENHKNLTSPSLLIVDDEKDMLEYLHNILSSDYNVTISSDGKDAWEKIQKSHPDMILLDLMLPYIDGLELCRRIKQDESLQSTKIMLLTARIDEDSKIRALEYGADDFITKPFSSVEVKTRLRNLLHTSQLQRTLGQKNSELETTLNKLKQTQSQLIHSEKINALGSLSAGLLHEVNNPLNYTLAAIQLAQKDKVIQSDSDLKEIIDDIDEGMQRIKLIVSDLRSFAYPEQAEKQEVFNVAEAVESALRLTSHEHKNIVIHKNIDKECLSKGSINHIIHVVINLLSNAIEAVNASEKQDKIIEIECHAENKRLVISINDNGVGVEEEVLNRIFEPFFTTRDVGKGLGLGLSICHSIVANHSGTFKVLSEKNKWTKFSFDLPLATERRMKTRELTHA